VPSRLRLSITTVIRIVATRPRYKPAYVADWDDLPSWQRETDADIFERIERTVLTASRDQ
jgi:hypothetical protein